MEIVDIIQAVITILSTGAVAVILHQQIKSQKEQISAMQSNMESMQAYVNLIDVNRMKAMQKVWDETSIQNAQNVSNRIISEAFESDNAEAFFENIVKNHPMVKQYEELYFLVLAFLSILPPTERDELLSRHFPLNVEHFRADLAAGDQKDDASWIAVQQKLRAYVDDYIRGKA